MSEQPAALSFWRDRTQHQQQQGSRSPDKPRDCPKPMPPPKPNTRNSPKLIVRPIKPPIKSPAPSLPPPSPPRPRHGTTPPPSPPQKKLHKTVSLPSSSQSSSPPRRTSEKVPLLPPGSSWKRKSPSTTTLRDEGGVSSPKVIARTTRPKPPSIATATRESRRVSEIIGKLGMNTAAEEEEFGHFSTRGSTASSRGSEILSSRGSTGSSRGSKISLKTPPSVPVNSVKKKFVLPTSSSLPQTIGGGERVKTDGESITVREGLLKHWSSEKRVNNERSSSLAAKPISEEKKKKKEDEEEEERGGERRGSRTYSGSRRSAKIKSSWTCYLDGPDTPSNQQRQSRLPPPPPPLSPPSSPPTSPCKSPQPPLSPTSSTSLIKSFSDSFRTSSIATHNYLRDNPSVSMETVQFWEMVSSLGKEGVGCHGYLTSPLLSPSTQSPPSSSSSSSSTSIYRTTTVSHHFSRSAAAGGDHMISVSMATTPGDSHTISFQCSAELTVAEVIRKGVARSERGRRSSSTDQWLKVSGRDEYLEQNKRMIDYVYIHNCLKLNSEVKVQIIFHHQLPQTLSCKPKSFKLPETPPTSLSEDQSSFHTISSQELNNLLDSYVSKATKFRNVVKTQRETPTPIPIPALVQTVISCVRLLCERLLYVEPPSLSDAITHLRHACKPPGYHGNSAGNVEEQGGVGRIEDDVIGRGNYIMEEEEENEEEEDNIRAVEVGLEMVQSGVHHLVTMYCLSLLPGYLPEWWAEPKDEVPLSRQDMFLRVKVCALHKLPVIDFRRYSHFQLEVCVYHGGLPVSKKTCSPPSKLSHNFFTSIVWNKWLNLGIPLSHLPREAKLCITVLGLEMPSAGGGGGGGGERLLNRTPVAWVIQKLFDSRGFLIYGPRLLGMWGSDEAMDPLDSPYPNTSNKSVLLELIFEDSSERVKFDYKSKPHPSHAPSRDNTQKSGTSLLYRGLKKMSEKDRFSSLSMEDEKLIWSNRFLLKDHLGSLPRGLPLLLLSAPHWRPPHRDDVWSVLGTWPCSDPVHGLELLDPQLADGVVRATAVRWLSGLHDDDLCDFLPQLVQSTRHDSYEENAMVEFLLRRSCTSPRVAHHLHWQLRILATAPGERYKVRYELMLQALDRLLGENLRNNFNTQEELIEQLVAVAAVVKATRDSHRQTVLVHELQRVGERFVGEFRLPLSPSLLVRGLDIEESSFFNSNTVPLKLSFLNSDPHGQNIDIIFKVGDDLRQDILVLQMIKMMEKVWLRAGLDLKMITYDCVATGQDHGMLELVTESATLRTIQTERGVTGSFKDKPLSNWLMRYNTSENDYRQAVDNFTCSCAGYCVATYVLGICDRHNDNIMVKKSGHMFHIDFGKILGNAQMFGNIKRDRVPFVLTRDMAYVINDGDRPTSRFQQFVDLCCTAYNVLRRHAHTLLSLLSLMLSSGIAELSSTDDIIYVRDALLPGRSDAEATYAFTKHIEDSLGSMATQINFFIHNLAQLKFSNPQAPPTLLSFVPQAYSIETDGRIDSAVVVAYYKKYYPDAHTVYQIQVTRSQVGTAMLFRRYREFDELHRRLTLCFPGDDLPTFPRKTYLPGKSRARETVEKRMTELNVYIGQLLQMEPRISESDVIYTFFHRLVRDQQEKTRIEEEGVNNEGGAVAGKVKVHLMYDKKTQSLSVMIRHVRDLVPREGSDSADPYVKMYLKPDVAKTTKQKTKIARRTLHPTYNETFTYKVPQEAVSEKSLELSVWDASILLNKQCLAIATVDLNTVYNELADGCGCWVELHSPAQILPPPPPLPPTSTVSA